MMQWLDAILGNHEIISIMKLYEYLILREERRRFIRSATRDFQKAGVGLFRGLVHRVPWDTVDTGFNFFQVLSICLSDTWMQELNASLARLLMIPNCEVLSTLLGHGKPCKGI